LGASPSAGVYPRTILLDIETAPNLGYTWGKWEQNVIDFKQSWYILSFAYKSLDANRITTRALPDFPCYAKDKENDQCLVRSLWDVLDEADIIVAHNGDRFDIRKSNARFIAHGLTLPSFFKSVDTLKIARKHFQFDSNKLDDLGHYLGVGRKIPHTGKHLWFGCMNGDAKAWRMMRRYNAHDVELLERIYLKLRPWAANHPNLNFFTRYSNCPVCQSDNLVKNGVLRLKTGNRQQFKCGDCGHQFRDGPLIKAVS
jgi:DNA polymerase elongation subunit (family B)